MISVAEAQSRVVAGLAPLKAEPVLLAHALGRVLAEDVASRSTQPPCDVSAMDGYAVRAEDVGQLPASLKVIGSVAAGAAFHGEVCKGEAVRIFTGAPVPKGATTIIIQENASINGSDVQGTIARLEMLWKQRIADRPFDYHFLDDDYNKLYLAEQRTSSLFSVAAGLAII